MSTNRAHIVRKRISLLLYRFPLAANAQRPPTGDRFMFFASSASGHVSFCLQCVSSRLCLQCFRSCFCLQCVSSRFCLQYVRSWFCLQCVRSCFFLPPVRQVMILSPVRQVRFLPTVCLVRSCFCHQCIRSCFCLQCVRSGFCLHCVRSCFCIKCLFSRYRGSVFHSDKKSLPWQHSRRKLCLDHAVEWFKWQSALDSSLNWKHRCVKTKAWSLFLFSDCMLLLFWKSSCHLSLSSLSRLLVSVKYLAIHMLLKLFSIKLNQTATKKQLRCDNNKRGKNQLEHLVRFDWNLS